MVNPPVKMTVLGYEGTTREMDYVVRLAPDHLIPPGHDFVMCRDDDETVLYLKRSVRYSPRLCTVLEDAWAAYRKIRHAPEPMPRQHVSA